jgi:hypothetical protein
MLGNLLVLAVIGFFGLAFAAFTFYSAREWSTLYYLSRYGELNDAEITNLTIDKSGRGENFFAEYHYYVGDMLYDGKQQISRKHYKEFQQQNLVTIRNAPTRPSWSRLAGSDFDNTYRNFSSYAAFAGILLCPPLIIFWVVSFVGTYLYLASTTITKKKKHPES